MSIVENKGSVEFFANAIRGAWTDSTRSILQVASIATSAYEQLEPSEYTQLATLSGLSLGTLSKLRMIHKRQSRFDRHVKKLPAAWTLLYELTRLSDAQFKRLVDEKKLRPDLTIKEISFYAGMFTHEKVKQGGLRLFATIKISQDVSGATLSKLRLLIETKLKELLKGISSQIEFPCKVSSDDRAEGRFMITFWCDEHPIIASKFNVTFHRIIGMNNRDFAQWSEGVRQFLGKHWLKDDIPPHNGTSLEQIEADMRGISMHRTYDFLQIDQSTFRRDVIIPDRRYGSFLKCLFTNIYKAGDGNRDGLSMFDYLVASKRTAAGKALVTDWDKRIEVCVRYDGIYQYSDVLRRTHKQAFDAKSGTDWILRFGGKKLKFWLEAVEKKQKRSDLIVSAQDLKKLIKNASVTRRQVKSMKIRKPTHYQVRIYNPDDRLFPTLFNILRVGLVRQGTNFPALVAKYLYQRYTNHLRGKRREIVIYDPSAGYGGRCLAALAAACDRPIRYIGTDPNSENWITPSKSRYEALAEFYSAVVGQKFHAGIDIFRLGSEVIHKDRRFQKNRGKIDLVFTSPPYFSAEVYSDEKTQSAAKFPEYDSWRDGFLKRTLMTCVEYLRPGGFLLWNIADISHEGVFFPLEEDSQSVLINLGMSYRGKLKLLLSSGRGGGKTNLRLPSTKNFVIVNGSIRKYEPIFVFQKPL